HSQGEAAFSHLTLVTGRASDSTQRMRFSRDLSLTLRLSDSRASLGSSMFLSLSLRGVFLFPMFLTITHTAEDHRLKPQESSASTSLSENETSLFSLDLRTDAPPLKTLQRNDTLLLFKHISTSSEEDAAPQPDTIHPLTSTSAGFTTLALSTSTTNPPVSTSRDSSWSPADHLSTEPDGVLSWPETLSSDESMSSEDLPLIFEPFEDTTVSPKLLTPEKKHTAAPELSLPAEIMTTPSTEASAEIRNTAGTSSSSENQRTPASSKSKSKSSSAITPSTSSSTFITASRFRLRTTSDPVETTQEEADEEMDSEEESEEDLSESTQSPHTRAPFTLLPRPHPPVWLQMNQGLAGVLLLVGALYSIRVIHRRRKQGFKHHNRKQAEEPNEPDNTLLLMESSEDEL
ncbi:hypothetical protein DNTS_029415, partial [Danionella cerebrum]